MFFAGFEGVRVCGFGVLGFRVLGLLGCGLQVYESIYEVCKDIEGCRVFSRKASGLMVLAE